MSSALKTCPECALDFAGGEKFCPVDGTRLLVLEGMDLTPSGGTDPLLGQTLSGRYRVLRKIGEGGMGIVYEAVHVMIEKSVAIKVLREDFSHREDVVERFRQEAKSATRIGHEHIIDISDFGQTPDGLHFFVMELLLGSDLAEVLELRGPLPPRRAVSIVTQCARALQAAHEKGIVHRDIKPENVFLVQRDHGDDFVKIVDFGIAKMSDGPSSRLLPDGRKQTGSGMIFGTPEYMSPEHAAGRALDHRVDIYALGIILYELLCGRPPFMGDTFMGILTLHMFEQVPPLRDAYPNCAAPPELEALVARMIAKSPDERPQSMGALADELLKLTPFLARTSVPPPLPGTHTYTDQPPLRLPPEHAFAIPPSVAPAPSYAPPAIKRLPPWVWLSAALVLSLGVLSTALLLRSQASSSAAVAPPKTEVPAPPPMPVLPAVPPAAPEPKPADSPDVTVVVVSHPEEAMVTVDGTRVCRSTPCRFQAKRGLKLALLVQASGFRSSRSELAPARDLNQVELELSPRRGGAHMRGDLMLPDAFGNR